MNLPEQQLVQLLARPALSDSDETLHRTLYLRLKQAISAGQLQARSRLPGSRTLARILGVSRNTVEAALEQLAVEGYLRRDRRGATVLALPLPLPVTQTVTVAGERPWSAGRMGISAGYRPGGINRCYCSPAAPLFMIFR